MECSICTDLITAETGQVTLACSHTFHLGCIGRWSTQGATNCPLCRANLGEKEIIEDDDAVSSVSMTERVPFDSPEFLARYLDISLRRAQMYFSTFNNDSTSVIEYVRYIRENSAGPLYIPPLESPHRAPVIPDRHHGCKKEFARKRYWLRYRKNVKYFRDRGYDTE